MADMQPSGKRAVAFIDGQNLYRRAKDAFGAEYLNYDARKLANYVATDKNLDLLETRFYSGVPDIKDDYRAHQIWVNRLRYMTQSGVKKFTTALRYYPTEIVCPEQHIYKKMEIKEKGIDVRIALDIVKLVLHNNYDYGIIFSQDQDLAEAIVEANYWARRQNRRVVFYCAFPSIGDSRLENPIRGCTPYPISKGVYDMCLDLRDHRPAQRHIRVK